jgi:DNA-binding NtrC family response regulator
MKHARTIAMATTLLADGRAGAVMDMVEPLLESVSTPAASTGQMLLRGLLARVEGAHRDRPERVFDLLPPPGEVTGLCSCVRAEVHLWRGWAHARRARDTEEAAQALRQLHDAQELFASICAPTGRGWALLGRAHAYADLEEYALMRQVLDDAAVLLDRLQDTQAQRWLHELSIVALRRARQDEEVGTHAEALQSIADTWADTTVQGHAASHIAALRQDQGAAPSLVLDAATTALRHLPFSDSAARAAVCRAIRARTDALGRAGDWEKAAARLQELPPSFLDRPGIDLFVPAQRARIALGRGRPSVALSLLDDTFGRRVPSSPAVRRVRLAHLYHTVLAAADRPSAADRWLRRTHRLAREHGHQRLQWRAAASLGDAPASISRRRPAAAVDGFVAESDEMKAVATTLQQIQPSHSPVLLTGERGAGKRHVAQAIHATSVRADGALERLSCAPTQTEEPLRAQLFGADASTGGAVQAADGGTLVVEDIDALPLPLQSALLRVISTGTPPHASSSAVPLDVRIVATTTADLEARVEEGRFSTGLWNRLGAIGLHVPPLRERRPDIPLLAQHFLTQLRPPGSSLVSITEPAMDALLRYNWPGNVRQLRNEIERALVHVRSEPAPTISLDTLHNSVVEGARKARTAHPPVDAPDAILEPDHTLSDVLARTETSVIEHVLHACDGQVTASAEVLGLTRQGLYKKMKRLDIDASSFQASAEAASTS